MLAAYVSVEGKVQLGGDPRADPEHAAGIYIPSGLEIL